MAKTKQFTIAVDNQPGAVAGIAKILGNAKVNILSLLGTAQGKAGTVQLVVDDARRAKKALDAARIEGFLGAAGIVDDELNRSGLALGSSQERKNIHLGIPKYFRDSCNCTGLIVNRDCELFSFG